MNARFAVDAVVTAILTITVQYALTNIMSNKANVETLNNTRGDGDDILQQFYN